MIEGQLCRICQLIFGCRAYNLAIGPFPNLLSLLEFSQQFMTRLSNRYENFDLPPLGHFFLSRDSLYSCITHSGPFIMMLLRLKVPGYEEHAISPFESCFDLGPYCPNCHCHCKDTVHSLYLSKLIPAVAAVLKADSV